MHMNTTNSTVEGPKADRFRRFMIFMQGFAASLRHHPINKTEPGPAELHRMPDGNAQSMRDELERLEVRMAVVERVRRAQTAQGKQR